MKTLFIRRLLDLFILYIIENFDVYDEDVTDSIKCLRNAIDHLTDYELK